MISNQYQPPINELMIKLIIEQPKDEKLKIEDVIKVPRKKKKEKMIYPQRKTYNICRECRIHHQSFHKLCKKCRKKVKKDIWRF